MNFHLARTIPPLPPCPVTGTSRPPDIRQILMRENRLLAELPAAELDRLQPSLKLAHLRRGQVLHSAGEHRNKLFFPITGVISGYCLTPDGDCAESALTGSEGVLGIALFLGGRSTLNYAVVVAEGSAYSLDEAAFRQEVALKGRLLPVLLRYTLALMGQMGQIAACNRHHSLEQRLCRWLLQFSDRSHARNSPVTQSLIAELLGVRRGGITAALKALQVRGLVQCTREHIAITDRAGLQVSACECVQVINGEYRRLFPSMWTQAGAVPTGLPSAPTPGHARQPPAAHQRAHLLM